MTENLIPLPVPAPCHPCSSSMVCPALEEMVEEPREAICNELDDLLRESKVERVRDLQEESFNSVICSLPRVGSDRWRTLNGIYQMCPGPGQRDQRATCSHPYLRMTSSRRSTELWGPGESGGQTTFLPSSFFGAVNLTLLWGAEELSPSRSGQSGLVLQGENLI